MTGKSYPAPPASKLAGTARCASAIDLFGRTGMEGVNLVGKPGFPVTLLPYLPPMEPAIGLAFAIRLRALFDRALEKDLL